MLAHLPRASRARRSRAGLRVLALTLGAVVLLALAPATAAAGVDDWVHIWEVVRLVDHQQSQPTPPGGVFVYYLGDSIARESIISDASWTRSLARRTAAAGKVTVSSARGLAGHNQTFGMDRTIVEGLPATPERQPRGIVLIGVGISRFIGPPVPLKLPKLDPVESGVEPPLSPWVQHHYDDRRPLSLARKRELVPRWMDRRWAGFRASKKKNVAAIQDVITLCKSKGLRPVLIDLPLDLRVVGSGLAEAEDRHPHRDGRARQAEQDPLRALQQVPEPAELRVLGPAPPAQDGLSSLAGASLGRDRQVPAQGSVGPRPGTRRPR